MEKTVFKVQKERQNLSQEVELLTDEIRKASEKLTKFHSKKQQLHRLLNRAQVDIDSDARTVNLVYHFLSLIFRAINYFQI